SVGPRRPRRARAYRAQCKRPSPPISLSRRISIQKSPPESIVAAPGCQDEILACSWKTLYLPGLGAYKGGVPEREPYGVQARGATGLPASGHLARRAAQALPRRGLAHPPGPPRARGHLRPERRGDLDHRLPG